MRSRSSNHGTCGRSCFRQASIAGPVNGPDLAGDEGRPDPYNEVLSGREEGVQVRTSVFVTVSVDGFIARANGELDFFDAGGDEPHGYDGVHLNRRYHRHGAKDLRDRPWLWRLAVRREAGRCPEQSAAGPFHSGWPRRPSRPDGWAAGRHRCILIWSRSSARVPGWRRYDSGLPPGRPGEAVDHHPCPCAHRERDSPLRSPAG